jgi:hypothetical protein
MKLTPAGEPFSFSPVTVPSQASSVGAVAGGEKGVEGRPIFRLVQDHATLLTQDKMGPESSIDWAKTFSGRLRAHSLDVHCSDVHCSIPLLPFYLLSSPRRSVFPFAMFTRTW